ncbi:MAG: GTP pyrophosphokinase family protein [Gordonia sp. (in: high G+C Gram-positive bacteria)]|uniref:GTP pyrophosphokinase family protein n=1 Tax=Gordonia sp. (in: high G+C Gram-positive bacteria) TaxID=84139 RepID=UPI0039E649B9
MNIDESMDLTARPPWSGKQLTRLGEAIARQEPAPENGPGYDDVMDWHQALAERVSAIVYSTEWTTIRGARHDVSARAKTHDTLQQKLIRETRMRLNQVQDLAGVRIDVDCSLDEQTALAGEIADHFAEFGEVLIRDIRANPHSGYRAVHLWLRFPAGRAEIQIRTQGQSAWANTYEQFGDAVGRRIRYGQGHDDPRIQQLVDYLQEESRKLAALEERHQELTDLREDCVSELHAHRDRMREIRSTLDGISTTTVEER